MKWTDHCCFESINVRHGNVCVRCTMYNNRLASASSIVRLESLGSLYGWMVCACKQCDFIVTCPRLSLRPQTYKPCPFDSWTENTDFAKTFFSFSFRLILLESTIFPMSDSIYNVGVRWVWCVQCTLRIMHMPKKMLPIRDYSIVYSIYENYRIHLHCKYVWPECLLLMYVWIFWCYKIVSMNQLWPFHNIILLLQTYCENSQFNIAQCAMCNVQCSLYNDDAWSKGIFLLLSVENGFE